MLSGNHYYHRTIRKLVVAFGSIFNNMRMVRYDQSTNSSVEIERINVPLMYASKEKFYKSIMAVPDLENPVNLTLPRMAFEMNGITYDPLRKISNFQDQFAEGLPLGLKKVKVTPYNFDFNLYAFVRNTEDGAQIIEQVLPYFTPDYTVKVDFVGITDWEMDVPIVFNSITYDDSHEGDTESTRSIVWTLNFTMKAYLFGKIDDIKMIRKATANIYDNTFETNPLKSMSLRWDTRQVGNSANIVYSGEYKYDELVYQGRSFDDATATGYVHGWSNTTNTIVVYDTNGTFRVNVAVVGAVSGARYNVTSYGIVDKQLVNISVVPRPNTANSAAEAYGFSTTITEYN